MHVLTVLATLLIWKVTASVVIEYRNYLPPNFEATFLLGREEYFYGPTFPRWVEPGDAPGSQCLTV